MPNFITIRKVNNHLDTETFSYKGPITIHGKDGSSVEYDHRNYPLENQHLYESFSFVTEDGNKVSKSLNQYWIYSTKETLR